MLGADKKIHDDGAIVSKFTSFADRPPRRTKRDEILLPLYGAGTVLV